MTEWLSTRTKGGKRKRSVEQIEDVANEEATESFSQDVLEMKPLKRARVTSIAKSDDSPAVKRGVKAKAEEEESSALRPDECDELLYFIEHNYLSSLSALMYSLKDLLFVAEPEGPKRKRRTVAVDDRFLAEFNRLREMKEGIVRKVTRNGSAPGTPVSGRKRPTSAYHLFIKEHYASVRDENPDLPFGELISLAATKWREMSDEDKAPYVQKAAEVCTLLVCVVLRCVKPKPNPRLQQEAKSGAASETEEPVRTKRVSAWSVFFGEQMAERSKSDGLTRQELAKSIGEDWKNLSEADRKKYAALAEVTHLAPAHTVDDAANSAHTPGGACVHLSQERASQPSTPRPRRAAPGWAVFRNEQTKIFREEKPDMAAADRLKELHAQWDALSDEQRAKYRAMAVRYTTTV